MAAVVAASVISPEWREGDLRTATLPVRATFAVEPDRVNSRPRTMWRPRPRRLHLIARQLAAECHPKWDETIGKRLSRRAQYSASHQRVLSLRNGVTVRGR